MAELALELALGFGIGLTLGLLGGGGSILTVPALVYLVGQTPQSAMTTALAIVGANSAVGAAFHNRRGSLNWKVALAFGGAGMGVSYLAAGLSRFFTPALLMVLFAGLMLLVGAIMLGRREVERVIPQTGEPPLAFQPAGLGRAVGAGVGVGLLTGLLGVGGGFLIVPALVMLLGLPMYQAVGTSLAIIAANSLAGLLGHLSADHLDLGLTLVFVVTGIAGTYTGARLAHRLPARRLRQAFAIFVIGLAVFLLFDNGPRLFG